MSSEDRQGSRRETAERVVITHVNPFTSVDMKALTVAIEAALKERDERAAKITEAHIGHGAWCASAEGDCQTLTVRAIAAAIRNEEPHA